MQSPLQITFRAMAHSDALEAHLRSRAVRLNRYFDRITSCRIVVDASHKHQSGGQYRVSIDLTLPHGELAVSRTPTARGMQANAYAAADLAFHEAKRRLEDWKECRRAHHARRP